MSGTRYSKRKNALIVPPAYVATEHRHCDEYIADDAAPPALRRFLEHARAPAHGMLQPPPAPALFADLRGRRVRVVMASRLGDVGITSDLGVDVGYQTRCTVDELSNFAEVP